MSTTYYWYRPRELDREAFQAWSEDCRRIIETAASNEGARVIVRGENGTGEPVVTPDLIAFNGDGASGLDFEPFIVSRIMTKEFRDRIDEAGRIFRFCKVAGRPYENIVAECLAAFEMRFGRAIQVETDASGQSTLTDARARTR